MTNIARIGTTFNTVARNSQCFSEQNHPILVTFDWFLKFSMERHPLEIDPNNANISMPIIPGIYLWVDVKAVVYFFKSVVFKSSKRWRCEIWCIKMLSAPSFGCYWKRFIWSPYHINIFQWSKYNLELEIIDCIKLSYKNIFAFLEKHICCHNKQVYLSISIDESKS